MFNYFKIRALKRQALKYDTQRQYYSFLERCEFGTFQFCLFVKALGKLNSNENPKDVIKWVNSLEKKWNI